MVRSITEGLLAVNPPDGSGRDNFFVPAADVLELNLGAEAGEGVGQGDFTVNSPDGRYTTGDTEIRSDDRIYVDVTIDADVTEDPAFGSPAFGDGPFGGGPAERVGTLIVTDTSVDGLKHSATLTGSLENFVFNRLSEQQTNYSEDDLPIATGDDDDPGHLDSILADDAPDVARDEISAVDTNIDFTARKMPVRKAVAKLARIARSETGDPVIVAPRGSSLLFQPLSERSLSVSDTLTLGSGGDLAELETTTEPPTLTSIRVEGGIDDTDNIDEEETVSGNFETVTTSTRLTYQLAPRKPEISKVHLWVRHIDGSDADLRVRLQSDAGGSPVAINDTDSDLTSGRISIPEGFDGEKHTRFGDHVLGPSDTPHLIIEATTDDGIDVETDGAGTPRFHTHFPKPVIIERTDPGADATFRSHERAVNNDALTTFEAANELAKAHLERKALARTTVTARAQSVRAHELKPGDLVDLDAPWARAEGTHVVKRRSQAFTDLDGKLVTELGFESDETYI